MAARRAEPDPPADEIGATPAGAETETV